MLNSTHNIPGGILNQFAWVFTFSILIAASSAHAQTSATPSKSAKLEQLRKALRGGQASGPAPRHPPPKAEAIDMQMRARDELRLNNNSYSDGVAPSVAVVRTQSILAKDPVYYSGLQIGVNVQPYAPQGKAPLVSLGERSLSSADATYLLGLEARYMPWISNVFGEHSVGFRVGASYARQELNLFAQTGVRLGNSNLHSLQTYALLSQQWALPRAKYWSVNVDAGVSRFDMLLTSQTSLGEVSDDIWLATLRMGPSFRLGDLSFNLNYERRQRVTDGWARMEENGIMLGILYGIR